MGNFTAYTFYLKKQNNKKISLSKLGKEVYINIITNIIYKKLQVHHSQHEKPNTFYLKIRKNVKIAALITSI